MLVVYNARPRPASLAQARHLSDSGSATRPRMPALPPPSAHGSRGVATTRGTASLVSSSWSSCTSDEVQLRSQYQDLLDDALAVACEDAVTVGSDVSTYTPSWRQIALIGQLLTPLPFDARHLHAVDRRPDGGTIAIGNEWIACTG